MTGKIHVRTKGLSSMGHLMGLKAYLEEHYNSSVFDRAVDSGEVWEMHLHGHRIIRGRVVENLRYDIRWEAEGGEEEIIPKILIKLLYPGNLGKKVSPLLKTSEKVKALGLEAIKSPNGRRHIKNKSLFPLMMEKVVLFFILLEGEVVRGVLTEFTRYEVTVNLKGGLPITVLRHAIYDLTDKKGRCFLKERQEVYKDWEKSPLYVKEG